MIDGRFELLERLGSGGMGTVWRARDVVLHRDVALKEVRPHDPGAAGSADDSVRVQHERVLREARALARLRHPHVVAIHHIVDADPYPWLVMEFVPGISLQTRLEHGPLAPREAARIGRDVLAALRAAHAAGIHHRDVKPANILLSEGPDGSTSAVLTDFGIADLPGVSPLTDTGLMVGSPEYMAPERVRGADDAPASDLWSLGITLYVAVEGRSPMRRGTGLATLAAVLGDPVPPPVQAGPLAPVLSGLLAADPQARPDAARLDAMLAAVADDATGAHDLPAAVAAGNRSAGADGLRTAGAGVSLTDAPTAEGTVAAGVPPTAAATKPLAVGPDHPAVDASASASPRAEGSAGQQAYGALMAGEPPVTHRTPTRPARRALWPAPLMVAAAVVVLAVIAAASYRFLTPATQADASGADRTGGPAATVTATVSGSATASGRPGKSPTAKGSAEASGGSASADRSAAAAAAAAGTGASPGSGTAAQETPSEAEATTTTGTGGSDATDATDGAEAYANSWLALLAKSPVDAGTAKRDQKLAAVRAQVPAAEVLLSGDFESLGGAYWVIYVPRSFGSGVAAVDYCASVGRTTADSCMGRYLSHDAADSPLKCQPDGAGGVTGRCTGP
ncbi:serine/threonine-protein kinase [Streptomyces sp. YKOK-I1]